MWPSWDIQEFIWKTCSYIGQVKYNRSVKFIEIMPEHLLFTRMKVEILARTNNGKANIIFKQLYTLQDRWMSVGMLCIIHKQFILTVLQTNWNYQTNFLMKKCIWKFIDKTLHTDSYYYITLILKTKFKEAHIKHMLTKTLINRLTMQVKLHLIKG